MLKAKYKSLYNKQFLKDFFYLLKNEFDTYNEI